jgi:2-polyprenyl-6-hydroxyphenyl methylase / 3-demethylubiquinone-9 3-methyltransferase
LGFFIIMIKIIIFTIVLAIFIQVFILPTWFYNEFPDRLAKIPDQTTYIDNDFYENTSWWNNDDPMNLLSLMNIVRMPYFDKHIRSHYNINDELEDRNEFKVLDVGCGGGLLTEPMARLGYSMVGVDMHQGVINAANAHLSQNHTKDINLKYVQGNAYELPFEDESFDAIVCSDVFEHFHDLNKAVNEMYRVLKPNGILVYDTISRTVGSYWFYIIIAQELNPFLGDIHDWRLFIKPEEMVDILERNKFIVDKDAKPQGFSIIPRLPWNFDFNAGIPNGLLTFIEMDSTWGSYMSHSIKGNE